MADRSSALSDGLIQLDFGLGRESMAYHHLELELLPVLDFAQVAIQLRNPVERRELLVCPGTLLCDPLMLDLRREVASWASPHRLALVK